MFDKNCKEPCKFIKLLRCKINFIIFKLALSNESPKLKVVNNICEMKAVFFCNLSELFLFYFHEIRFLQPTNNVHIQIHQKHFFPSNIQDDENFCFNTNTVEKNTWFTSLFETTKLAFKLCLR